MSKQEAPQMDLAETERLLAATEQLSLAQDVVGMKMAESAAAAHSKGVKLGAVIGAGVGVATCLAVLYVVSGGDEEDD